MDNTYTKEFLINLVAKTLLSGRGELIDGGLTECGQVINTSRAQLRMTARCKPPQKNRYETSGSKPRVNTGLG
jgi:hypothetical protein